jgi:hypothetical protein
MFFQYGYQKTKNFMLISNPLKKFTQRKFYTNFYTFPPVAPPTAFEADGGSCLPTPSVLSVPPPHLCALGGGEEEFVLISA